MTNHPNSLDSSQLTQLKSMLLEERQWLEAHLQQNGHFGLNESMRDQIGELSVSDNHPADIGSEMFERSKDIGLHENRERHLTDVKEALSRMERGEYGYCQACGAPISYERLQAIPSAAYCVNHVPDPGLSQRRPVEEQFLAPPFGRTSLDELSGQNQFDGEDAWQIVESWGTSNSPALAENPETSSNYNEMEVEADENDGYVEALESFLATDMYGQHVTVVRNKAYQNYMNNGEGEGLLEPDRSAEDDY